jgi:hypothetical protein
MIKQMSVHNGRVHWSVGGSIDQSNIQSWIAVGEKLGV